MKRPAITAECKPAPRVLKPWPPPPEAEPGSAIRQHRGEAAYRRGRDSETLAAAALSADGWHILATRLRTEAGEIDLVAERDGVVAFIEVKARPSLSEAAFALGLRQRQRLAAAAEIALAEHPEWGAKGVRFDVVLVDDEGRVRRIANAFGQDGL